MTRYVAEIQMNTRIQVQVGFECEDINVHAALDDIKKGLVEDGATEVEIVSCQPVIEVSEGSRALN